MIGLDNYTYNATAQAALQDRLAALAVVLPDELDAWRAQHAGAPTFRGEVPARDFYIRSEKTKDGVTTITWTDPIYKSSKFKVRYGYTTGRGPGMCGNCSWSGNLSSRFDQENRVGF